MVMILGMGAIIESLIRIVKMDQKKKYSLGAVALLEMLLSLLLALSFFFPWLVIKALGETIPCSLTDKSAFPYIFVAVFLANVILKCVMRSRWLSLIAAVVAILMHTELGAATVNMKMSTGPDIYNIQYVPAIGEQMTFVLGLFLLAVVSISWIVSLFESIAVNYRKRRQWAIYFSCLGLFFLILLLMFIAGVISAGNLDAVAAVDTSLKNVFNKTCIYGFPVFFLAAVVCGIRSLLGKDQELAEEEKPIDVEERPVSEVPSSASEEPSEVMTEKEEPSEVMTEKEEPLEDSSVKEIPKSKKTICAIIAAAVLLIAAGFYFFAKPGSANANNPLGVQKPNWEKFVKTTSEGVKLYKEADTSSPYLMVVAETFGQKLDSWLRWSDEKVPNGQDVYDFTTYEFKENKYKPHPATQDILPVLEENEGWYKVYVGTGEIREAYIQKADVEELVPEPITNNLLLKLDNKHSTHRLIEEGENANLYLECGFFNGVDVGVLIDGCIVVPKDCKFTPKENEDSEGVEFSCHEDVAFNDHTWEFHAPKSYWKATGDDNVFDVNMIQDTELRQIVMELKPSKEVVSRVWYYFPTVATDHFFEFEYSFSPISTTDDVKEDGGLVSNYKVEGDKLMAEVNGEFMAEVNGEFIDAEFTDLCDLQIVCTSDLDHDGSLECLLSGHPECEMLLVYCMIIYDSENGRFNFGKIDYIGEPKIENYEDRSILVMHSGLHSITYTVEGYMPKKLEDEIKPVGPAIVSVDIDDVFDDEGMGTKKVVTLDIDGDGADDQVHFQGVSMDGDYVTIESIILANGRTINTSIGAVEVKVLKSKTEGMLDIIADDYLFRWNGSSYEPVE